MSLLREWNFGLTRLRRARPLGARTLVSIALVGYLAVAGCSNSGRKAAAGATGGAGSAGTTGSGGSTAVVTGSGGATGGATDVHGVMGGGGATGGVTSVAGATGQAGATGGATNAGGATGGTGSGGTEGVTDGGAAGGGGTASGGTTCVGVAMPVPSAERVSNGNPVLPPKWAFGILWGSYYDQVGPPVEGSVGNLLTAATQLRTDGYGGDLMWIDSSWLYHTYGGGTDTVTGARYICFQFDPTTFPDPGTMIGSLQKDHFHFGVWEWPWMGHGCQYFQQAVTNKYFVMNGGVPALATGGWHGDMTPAAFDFTNPAAVTWWAGLNQPLVAWGLDFMKLDTGGDVPAGGTLADSTKDYRTEYHRAASAVTRSYAEANNPDAKMNGGRGFILTHTSPSAGNDQLPGMWTDDTDSTWAGFSGQDLMRAAALNTKTSAGFWCGDTGGYGIGTANPTAELYIRWLEYSSFTPCQEIFGSKSVGSRFPWRYSTQAQTIAKQYLALRYRLLPFRYSNAQAAYHETPVKYPVTFIGTSQILVGSGQSQFLVQPVTTPGATSVAVQLPAGSQWIHYWTGTAYPGGATATVAAPIDQEPVFVKAGSIIPMGPPMQWVDQLPADPLTVDVYPAGATSYSLYEDDGMSQGYLGGAYSTTKLSADNTAGGVVVSIDPQVTARYAYSGQLCARGYVLKINLQPAAPASVMRDGNPVRASSAATFGTDSEGWYYDAAAKTVWVKFHLSSDVGTKVSF
jgi:alpha-glucosidase (family GH31 glycosyl hydrolase)